MRRTIGWFFCVVLLAVASKQAAVADEPITLKDVVEPSANTAEEPLAKQFSLDAAVRFLDSASLAWQRKRKCFACHTNYVYLQARPAVSSDAAAHAEVRKFAEELVSERWKTNGPRWNAEVVVTAAALAFNDAATTCELHPLSQVALDRMWTVQREDGGWNWLKCNWPPMESDDHYGVTLAALAVAVAPADYAKTEAAHRGLERIRKYLQLSSRFFAAASGYVFSSDRVALLRCVAGDALRCGQSATDCRSPVLYASARRCSNESAAR